MSDSGFLARRAAIHRRRWSAPIGLLPHVGNFPHGPSADNESSYSSSTRRRWPRRPTLPAIYVPRFGEETSRIEPNSPFSYSQTPVEFLPEPISPVPDSPTPSYHSFVLHTGTIRQPGIGTGRLSRTSTASIGSLPDYENIEGGPPTAYPGYSNYLIPGMELQNDEEEIWIGLEPSYWITAPFVTDPAMPRCPGFLDGSCPIREAHNAGSYFLERRAPSARLIVVLAHHNVQHIFEGNCPPAAVWAALLRRLTRSENEASEDLLFSFCWRHCPLYRSRVTALRGPRLDFRQSTVYVRRANRQSLRARARSVAHEESQDSSQDGGLLLGQIQSLENDFGEEVNIDPDDNADDLRDAYSLWDAYFSGNDGPDSSRFEEDREVPFSDSNSEDGSDDSVNDVDSVSSQTSNLVEAPWPSNDEEGYIDSTYFFLPVQIHLADSYHQYGFTLPSDISTINPPVDVPPYPPCTSSMCPIKYPHAQGPYWDSGPVNTPVSLIPGPMAHLRAAPNLATYLDSLAEHGLGDLFGAETSPPMFILAAVERIVDGSPRSSDLRLVERFRFFHCRACRPIVMPDEEAEDHEEDEEELPLGSEEGYVMDSDDWAQYFD